VNNYTSDIPLETAVNAFYNVSMRPEGRGARWREGYAAELANDYSVLLELAQKHGTENVLEEEFARYREGYKKRNLAYLHSESRCISSFITGPSNFPMARAEKRNNISHKRLNEMCDYRTRAVAAIRRKLCPSLIIRTEDADAIEKLEANIMQAEIVQERMKQANAAIKKNWKHGQPAVIEALEEIGFSNTEAHKLILPGRFQGMGFASYQLTNNNANIRRMKDRVAAITRLKAKPEEKVEGENARLEVCPEENRVRLFFPGKPDAGTISQLKSNGFRWTPSLGCWQAYCKQWNIETAKRIAGITT
jgi:hypothetical protein